MAVHTLSAQQTIPTSLPRAWDFFSSPHNLALITPPTLGFQVITPDLPARIYPGLMVAYQIRPILRVPLTWLTEITHVEEGVRFVDEQRAGPYAIWHHEHMFRDLGDGRVEVRDQVTYVLHFGLLGESSHRWLVRPQLERIFAFRDRAICRAFPA